MAAYNWINIEAFCPHCNRKTQIKCQTHIASAYDGDNEGRFFDKTYKLGEKMRWWPKNSSLYRDWRVFGKTDFNHDTIDYEACYSTCTSCGSSLFAVLEFNKLIPTRVLSVGLESDWPQGYMK